MPWEKKFNQEDVLGHAMRAFWAHGYEATSVQDLVDCTGVNRGSLYATFGDKRELFMATLRKYDETMRQKLLADLEAHHSPREAIRLMFEGFIAALDDRRDPCGCFLTNTALELAPHDIAVGQFIAATQEDTEAFFVRMIGKGQADGSISAAIDPVQAGRGLLASLIGLIVLTRSRPDKGLLHAIIDDALHRFG